MAREVVETQCTNSALPRQLKQAIDRLQQQEVTLTSEKIDLESQLKSAQQVSHVFLLLLEILILKC